MALAKLFFPLVLISTAGGAVVMNRKLSHSNSEEIEMDVISKGVGEIENSWGEKLKANERKISFWIKDTKGHQRNKNVRAEIHKNIFIFDLCNEWIKFAGDKDISKQNHLRSDEIRNNNDENDETSGYGYTWKDVCEIVKNENNGINYFSFLTKVMKKDKVVQLVEACCGEKNICAGINNWEQGKWLKKCFDLEREKENSKNQELEEKICKSLLKDNSSSFIQVSEENKRNCIDEKIGKKISSKIKISRNNFENNNATNYWCSNQNGYANKQQGNERKINEECHKTLKQKLKEFVENEPKNNNLEKCWTIYKNQKVEVKCEDGWIMRISSI